MESVVTEDSSAPGKAPTLADNSKKSGSSHGVIVKPVVTAIGVLR